VCYANTVRITLSVGRFAPDIGVFLYHLIEPEHKGTVLPEKSENGE
jgi:hypothetical protein